MTTIARVRALPWRDVERPALVMVWVAGGLLAAQALHLYISLGKLGADSHAYWATAHRPDLYGPLPGSVDAFNYSPAFAQLVWPLAHLPWPVFCATWITLEVAAFLWLLRPLGWGWAGALTLVCAAEWTIGNVVPFLAIAAVLGMRSSGWWAAVALVKPTMALGPVWFAARGEWAKVGVSALVTAAVVAASAVLWPGAWVDWLGFLADNGGASSLSVRVAVAVLLTVVAARLDARWLLVVAMLLATPVWAGAASLTLLAGLPRMLGHDRTPRLSSEAGRLAVPRGGDPREPIGRGSPVASGGQASGVTSTSALVSEGPSPVAASEATLVRMEMTAAMPAADKLEDQSVLRTPVPSATSSAASVWANVLMARSRAALTNAVVKMLTCLLASMCR